jgi:chromosomal replication initiator protein
MLSSSRKKEITLPRMVAMHVAREIADFSFPEIGEAFGGKNHTTVIHAHRKIAELAKNDTSIRNRIGIIMSKLAKS